MAIPSVPHGSLTGQSADHEHWAPGPQYKQCSCFYWDVVIFRGMIELCLFIHAVFFCSFSHMNQKTSVSIHSLDYGGPSLSHLPIFWINMNYKCFIQNLTHTVFVSFDLFHLRYFYLFYLLLYYFVILLFIFIYYFIYFIFCADLVLFCCGNSGSCVVECSAYILKPPTPGPTSVS